MTITKFNFTAVLLPCALALAGCDDTADALEDESAEEVREAEAGLDEAEKEAERAAADAERDVEQAVENAEQEVDEADRELAEEIREEE